MALVNIRLPHAKIGGHLSQGRICRGALSSRLENARPIRHSHPAKQVFGWNLADGYCGAGVDWADRLPHGWKNRRIIPVASRCGPINPGYSMIRKSGYRFSLATNAKRLRGDHAQTKR